VTIRLIAQNGVLRGQGGELYLQGEAAMGKATLPPPYKDRRFHLFCSPHNVGAAAVAAELKESDVWVTKGSKKKISAPLTYTTDVRELSSCDHMLVLLDDRTWTSGETTKQLIEDIYAAMRLGVHLCCVHEFPSLVGPPRHECEFALMFQDSWTPTYLQGGPTNLYKEIALALKGAEWRKPGLVAFAFKLAAGGDERKPIKVDPPVQEEAEKEEPAKAAPEKKEDKGSLSFQLSKPQNLPTPVNTPGDVLSSTAAGLEASPASNLEQAALEQTEANLSDRIKNLFSTSSPSPQAAVPAPQATESKATGAAAEPLHGELNA